MKKNNSYESSMLGLCIGWIGIIVLSLFQACTSNHPNKIGHECKEGYVIDTVDVIDEDGIHWYSIDTLRP